MVTGLEKTLQLRKVRTLVGCLLPETEKVMSTPWSSSLTCRPFLVLGRSGVHRGTGVGASESKTEEKCLVSGYLG